MVSKIDKMQMFQKIILEQKAFSGLIVMLREFLFNFDDINRSLLHLHEAVEDIPDQDSSDVKKLRRMLARVEPVSG